MPIGTSGSVLVVIVDPPSPAGTTTDVTNYGRADSCRHYRLTGQSFVTFPGLRSSEVVERCPGVCDRAGVDVGGSCHRRIAVDTFPIDGALPRPLGGCQADLE